MSVIGNNTKPRNTWKSSLLLNCACVAMAARAGTYQQMYIDYQQPFGEPDSAKGGIGWVVTGDNASGAKSGFIRSRAPVHALLARFEGSFHQSNVACLYPSLGLTSEARRPSSLEHVDPVLMFSMWRTRVLNGPPIDGFGHQDIFDVC